MTQNIFPIEQYDRLLEPCPGRIGVYVKDLNTAAVYEYHADELFPTASICKVPVMIGLYQQVHQGKLSLDDRRRLPDDIGIWGTGTLQHLRDAPELTLRDYCRLMIDVSDNMATDLLMDIVGFDLINATMDELGFHHTRVNMTMARWMDLVCDMRGVPCNHANYPALLAKYRTGHRNWDTIASKPSLDNNVTTPREMGTMMERIQGGRIVSPEASAEMLEILKHCTSRDMIPRDLVWSVEVAHKVGSGCGVKADSGIVYLPSGPLVVSVMLFDKAGGTSWIGDITRRAVDALSPESVAGGK